MSATTANKQTTADGPRTVRGLAQSARAWAQQARRHPRTWIVFGAFLARLLWIVAVPSHPVGDFAMYRESAAFLVDQGELDPEFIYMPGYVFLLAAVQALGGGLLAAKMIGVVSGTAVTYAVGGIADALGGRRAGIIAAAMAAAWPAGIAVCSVMGTDMPGAALVVLAVLALVRLAGPRPWHAVVVSGVLLGLAAWIRAVAAPLGAVSVVYWLAIGVRPSRALARTGATVAVALLVLLPWGIRNQQVYGQFFLTDSHGGATALIGANPNSEGAFSRSLNLMFLRATGYRVLDTTARHRDSDRAAYQLARRFGAHDRAYAAGLLALKADRLLSHERNLLYWPLFRQGVLGEDQRAFFDRHRGGIETMADLSWWLVTALFGAGVGICAARRGWPALALLAFPLALAGIYTLFFAEVRYHLAIAPLVFPMAAFAVDWALGARHYRFAGERRSAVMGAAGVVLLFGLWATMLVVGAGLRARHRWAVSLCSYPGGVAGQSQLCLWSKVLPVSGPSPVRGVWDGVGLRVGGALGDDVHASVRTVLPLPPGRYRVQARLSVAGKGLPAGAVAVAARADGRVIARTVSPTSGVDQPRDTPVVANADSQGAYAAGPRAGELHVPISGVAEHSAGPLLLEFEIEPGGARSVPDGGTVWISQLGVERF